MNSKVTIKDVAVRAGCSIATVSRVLNKSGPSSAASREKVIAAAGELGFQFNELGRSLQSQRTRTIGVIVPTLANPVFADAIEGIQATADDSGYQMLLNCANYDPAREEECLSTLLGKQVDAVILTVSDPATSQTLATLRGLELPYCLIFNQNTGDGHPEVGVDNTAAADIVGDVLVTHGHHNVVFVAVRFSTSDRSRQRYAGLCQAMARAGCPEPQLLEVDYEPENLELALAGLLAREPQTTALFASNDMLALACIRGLRALGKTVPDDISVVGFDGISIGDLVDPSLATIVTPGREMGRQAAAMMITALETNGRAPGNSRALSFTFRPGGSLAPRATGTPAGERSLPRRSTSPLHLITNRRSE
ncbi:MAG: LacI family DNA-binding transcriptional regulator [Rhodospirillales bacterium]